MRCPEFKCGKYYKMPHHYVTHLVKKHGYKKKDAVMTLAERNCYKCKKPMINVDAPACIRCGAWHGDPKLVK